MPIEIGFGARAQTCACPPCGDDPPPPPPPPPEGGVDTGCCPSNIPTRLYVTILTDVAAWDGVSFPIDYEYVGGDWPNPHQWIGYLTGDVCGGGTGGPPFRLGAKLTLRGDLGQPPCRWELELWNNTPDAHWCKPIGIGLDNGFDCGPLSIAFEVGYHFEDDVSFGTICDACGALFHFVVPQVTA